MAREINLDHICKIEGHASLTLKIDNNKVKVCELKAEEGARFFEALVINKNLIDVSEIVSRICGICSSAHTVCAIQALEEALKIKPDETQKIIREFLMIGERIRSHATHLYFLTLPDYYNVESALELGPEHKDKINDALTLITLGNKIVETFGGREMHPFLKIKAEHKIINLEDLKIKLNESKKIILKTIDLFSNLDFYDISRDTDYLSLKENNYYSTISGKVFSNNETFKDNDYKKHLSENIKEYATSKFVLKNNKPYHLGAIARLNNNFEKIDPEVKSILEKYLKKKGLSLPFKNPHLNNFCQAIELMICVNRVLLLIDHYEKIIPDQKREQIKIIEGVGVSAVEAPRGTLFHEYKINKTGIIEYCNIITPTAQNLNMMELDITNLVNDLLEKKYSKSKIVKEIEKLIRSYDPCFSCSTHFLKVNWI